MTDKKLKLGMFSLRATDGLILATLILFTLLAIIFNQRVEGWLWLVISNIIIGFAYLIFNHSSDLIKVKFWKFFFRVTAVTLMYAYLFGAVAKLQMIIHSEWLDYYVIDFEQWLLGVQPTLWLEDYISKPLTEWMMFAYVIYIPLYPVLCGIIYYLRGELAMEDYFFTLGLTNIICDIGFILFPVASPMYYIKHLYSVPLEGYFWTYLGEFVRNNLHYAGGSIPSPHAAAATVMWIMAYKYHRPTFWILAPIILSLYISTFYCRYHYMTDAVVGILAAFVALAFVPVLIKIWNKYTTNSLK